MRRSIWKAIIIVVAIVLVGVVFYLGIGFLSLMSPK